MGVYELWGLVVHVHTMGATVVGFDSVCIELDIEVDCMMDILMLMVIVMVIVIQLMEVENGTTFGRDG